MGSANFIIMYKKLQLFSWSFLLFLTGIMNNNVSAQNTFYYNKYKHWTPELESLAINGNDMMAITSLGSCYDRADGVERDTQKAFKLFQRAAELGDFLGLYNLGWYYFAGIATEKNYLLSEKYLLEAIRKNPKLTPAYEGLSNIYDKGGFGVEADNKKAFEMYSKAYNLGSRMSLFNMGTYYEQGKVTGEPDYARALDCFLKVKDFWEANITPAGLISHKIAGFYNYGQGIDIDIDKAISFYENAVSLGYFQSCSELSVAYHKKGDLKNCFNTLLLGYEKGNMLLCNNLGDAYYYGRGTVQSFEKAYKIFEKGAETSPLCKYRQSEMLRKGEGVANNNKLALLLLEESADSGCEKAQYRLGCELYEGKLIPRNYTKAIDLFIKALEGKYMIDEVKGDICRKLSICYRFGRGVEANENQANEYNRLAASYGESNAKKIEEWLNHL